MDVTPIPILITIEWFPTQSKLPDSDITVLMDVAGEPFQGHFDGDNWRDCSGFPIAPEDVRHWAHMPAVPDRDGHAGKT